MTKYVLHGGYGLEKNSLNRQFYEMVARELDPEDRIFVWTLGAEDRDDSRQRYLDARGILYDFNEDLQVECSVLEAYGEQLNNATVVLFLAGDFLRSQMLLQQVPHLRRILSEKKLVVASGVGIYPLCKWYDMSDIQYKVCEGLGLLPLVVQAQCDSYPLSSITQAYLQQKAQQHGCEFLQLRDYEYVTREFV